MKGGPGRGYHVSKCSGKRHHCGIACVCVCEHRKFHGMATSMVSSEAERGSISQNLGSELSITVEF